MYEKILLKGKFKGNMNQKTLFCDICKRILYIVDQELYIDTYGPQAERVCLNCIIFHVMNDKQIYDLD